MKRFAFAIGLLALGFVATTPARADFGVARFHSGFCRVWLNTGNHPMLGHLLWFRHHHHWFYRFATWGGADSARLHAIAHHRCR